MHKHVSDGKSTWKMGNCHVFNFGAIESPTHILNPSEHMLVWNVRLECKLGFSGSLDRLALEHIFMHTPRSQFSPRPLFPEPGLTCFLREGSSLRREFFGALDVRKEQVPWERGKTEFLWDLREGIERGQVKMWRLLLNQHTRVVPLLFPRKWERKGWHFSGLFQRLIWILEENNAIHVEIGVFN